LWGKKEVIRVSPIRQSTIRVERWTETTEGRFKLPGNIKTQVLAEGDDTTPGLFVYKGDVLVKNASGVSARNLLVDVRVNIKTGEIIQGEPGIWRKYKER
jgi:hypothetical protein